MHSNTEVVVARRGGKIGGRLGKANLTAGK